MRRGLLVMALSLFVLPVVTASSASAEKTTPIAATTPCGLSGHVRYEHIVWILLENEGYSVIGSPEAPYLNSLTDRCGLATNYFAISHPSLPNYIALTSGTTAGITDDGEPNEHPLQVSSIFSQLNGNWRALEESMPSNCDHVTSGEYAARHDPAVYYLPLESACQRDDVPLTLPLDLSAAFTFITPNICDDMHSCPVADGDAWLARFVPLIIDSTEYQKRSLALFITFDENDSGPTNRVPTIVIAPGVPMGLRNSEAFTHYSLLRTTESLLSLSFLGGAKTASSMVNAFHL